MKRISTLFLAFATFAAIILCGCSNYRLAGTPVKLPFTSVYVMPVKNVSFAPQASNLLTNSISSAINQVPGLHTAYQSEAQATLETRIIDYKRVGIATREDDTALAASYRIEAIAECTLTRANGEIIFKNMKVKADTLLYPGNDLIGSEYQNMPIIMRELGNKIKDAVIGIW